MSAAVPADQLDVSLGQLYTDWAQRPFEWGQTDCCQFAIAAAQVLHGRALAFGAYRSARGAARKLASLGGYPGALARAQYRPLPVDQAQRGDLVLVDTAGADAFEQRFGGALAVVFGRFACAVGPCGLVSVSRERWRAAWRFETCPQ